MSEWVWVILPWFDWLGFIFNVSSNGPKLKDFWPYIQIINLKTLVSCLEGGNMYFADAWLWHFPKWKCYFHRLLLGRTWYTCMFIVFCSLHFILNKKRWWIPHRGVSLYLFFVKLLLKSWQFCFKFCFNCNSPVNYIPNEKHILIGKPDTHTSIFLWICNLIFL